MTTITKEALIAVLDQLDRKNDQHWTDDGSPRISVVRELAKDDTITRALINETVPGFARVQVDPAAQSQVNTAPEGEPPDDADAEDQLLNVRGSLDFDPSQEPEVNGSGKPLSEDEVRIILTRRVADAEAHVTACQLAVRDAQAGVVKAQAAAMRTKLDLNRRFPPLTPEANIKAHLKAHGERLEASVAQNGVQGRGQIDIAMERSNRRGWTRPVRPVLQGNAGAGQ